jgi:hypothetical protein
MAKVWVAAGVIGADLAALVWLIGSHTVEWMASGLAVLGQ